MIQQQQHLSGIQPVLPELSVPPEEILFFDIETTGLSPKTSVLSLAGAVFFQNGRWNCIQWLAESPAEEPAVLQTFFQFCQPFRCLIHFNGDAFDLPYLEGRAQSCGLETPFSHMESVDLYRRLRLLRRLYPLAHINQKTLETFLGIQREDRLSGRELIRIYHDYAKNRNTELASLLFLHNLDDLKGMLSLTQLLAYPALFSGRHFALANAAWEDAPDGQPDLVLELSLHYALPKPLSCKLEFGYLYAHDAVCRLLIHAYEGELKYFLPDYRNYYYLPDRNEAIHKNAASGVSPQKRIPAKADTCFLRRYGLFLPQKTPAVTPAFQHSRKDTAFWFECTEAFMNAENALHEYIKSLISI